MAGVRFMVNDNWRWQPWYREIKNLLDGGTIGEVTGVYFQMRMETVGARMPILHGNRFFVNTRGFSYMKPGSTLSTRFDFSLEK